MKNWNIILGAITLFLIAGCVTPPDDTSDISVRVGMSRNLLKEIYGEPLRIESNNTGGEDWYYSFYGWSKSPPVTTTSENVDGNTTSSTSTTWKFGNSTEEKPIHLSSEGRVVEPLPSGKVIKN